MKPARTALTLAALLATVLTISTVAAPPPESDTAILHVLNRIGFGARPGDVDQVRAMGVRAYVEQQLHPERIPDTSLDARLGRFATLTLSSSQIAEQYELPQLEARRERKQEAANQPSDAMPPRPTAEMQQANMPLAEMSQQKLLRAIYGQRQLQEVLTDFWFNHFNVDARKGPVRYLLTEYERDAIRPHVLGHFRELLGATAHSPAMLFYLDNWQSADPNGPHLDQARRQGLGPRGQGLGGRRLRTVPRGRARMPAAGAQAQAPRPNMPKGLNENYGRELLELHTLGVDGGYTQRDVTEVARAFTGWSIDQPRTGGGFRFAAMFHDPGEKIVLGHRIKAGGGEQDGEEVLDILAAHPSTARFIATKLARRFVSDTPPPALVERAADTFRKTDGDLRAVMTVLLTSPEFLSPAAVRAKVKTPFDFVVSAARATAAEVQDARSLVRALQILGMPSYLCQPPTGYADTADAWVNTGGLVNRMNIALELASGRLAGVRPPPVTTPAALIGGEISDATRNTIAKAADPAQAVALALGSPEFQRR